MPTSTTLLAVSLGLALVFAGCAGGSAKTGTAPVASSEIQASGSPIEGTGAITGVIIDDQTLPLAGVSIAVRSVDVGTTLEALTDEAGRFSVSGIAAGSYHVFAAKLGHESATKAVTVGDGETVTLTLTLAPILVDMIFHETIGPYNGFVTCAYTKAGISGLPADLPNQVDGSVTYNCPSQAGAALGSAVNNFDFDLAQENIQAIQGELRWTPGAVGTSQRLSLFLSPDGGSGGNWYCTNGGVSPVVMVWHVDEEKDQCAQKGADPDPETPEMDTTLQLSVYLPFDRINATAVEKSSPPNIVFQQKYESIATLFYGKDPEPAFSAFTDA